jgi:hypothetical protein
MRKISWVNFGFALLACTVSAQLATHGTDSGLQPKAASVDGPFPATHLPPTIIDGIPTCSMQSKLHPRADDIYKVGNGVKSPRPRKTPEAKFSDEASMMMKEKHLSSFEAVSVIGLTVSTEGNPEDLCLLRAAGYGLDRQVYLAVEKYRFNPATFNGKAVAVRIIVEVNFRQY